MLFRSTYDWWAKYISEQDATEEDIDLLAGKFDIDKSVIREAVAANTGDDYEQHRREAIAAIDEIRDEYAVTTAAATLGRKGGKSTSAAKSDAARENGRKGGRHLASYYVRIDSYWQNSGDFFVGPFANRDEAQTEIDRAVSDPESLVVPANQMAQDIEHGVRVHSILTKTQAKQAGLHESFGDTYERNVVGVKIPRTAHQMWHANDIF